MQLVGVFMPIAKLKKENSYLIGTEVKQLTVKNDNCMVRVGGGYVTIKEYYNRYATKQCVQLFQKLQSQEQTFNQVVLDLLETNQALPEVIEAYRSEGNWDEANSMFVVLSAFLEQQTKENNNLSPKKRAASKRKKGRSAAASP